MASGKEVKITIGSYFDARGVKASNEALAKIARDVSNANDKIRQATLRAAAAADSYAAKADKACLAMGGGYKTLAQQLAELQKTGTTATGGIAEGMGTATSSTLSMNDALGVTNGSFNGLLKSIAKLVPGIKNMGAEGAAAMGAWGAAIMSVIKFGQALYKIFEVAYNLNATPKAISSAVNHVYDLEQGAKRFREEMEESRKLANQLTKNFNEEVAAVNKLTQAQNEFNRAQELSLANSKEERDIINAKYNALNRDANEDAQTKIFDRREQDLNAEEDRIRQEIMQARKTQEDARSTEARLSKRLKAANEDVHSFGNYSKWLFNFSGSTSQQRNFDSIWNGLVRASNLGDEQDDIIDAKEKELEEIERKRKILAQERQTAELKAATDEQNAQNEIEERRRQASEEEAKREEQRIKKEIEDTKKAIKEIADERKKIENELHNLAVKNLRERIAEKKKEESTLAGVASSAQSEFDKAFAWYRDPEAAKRAIGEEQAYRDDMGRLHKDASRYGGKWRIDELSRLMAAGDTQGVSDTLASWRKSSKFSPQVEALVRASAAEQTKTTAEDELRKIAANTAKLDQKLEELLTMKGGD